MRKMEMAFVCLKEGGREREGGGGRRMGARWGFTIRYTQSQSAAVVNGLVLLKCRVQSTRVLLDSSPSRQPGEGPRLVPLKGGIKAEGLKDGGGRGGGGTASPFS